MVTTFGEIGCDGCIEETYFSAPSSTVKTRHPKWEDDDDDHDDDGLVSRFFDYGVIPALTAALMLVALLVASGAVYALIKIWSEIVNLVATL